jgi:hypothetical protein
MSSSIQDVIAAKQKAMIPQRLSTGAAVLGRLWRDGVRCRSEWSGVCPCAEPNDFCASKAKWLGLLREYHGGLPYGLSGAEGYLVLEAMTTGMFEATGLTLLVARPGDRVPLRIGPKGTDFQTLIDLAAIDDDAVQAVALDAVVKLQEVFRAG